MGLYLIRILIELQMTGIAIGALVVGGSLPAILIVAWHGAHGAAIFVGWLCFGFAGAAITGLIVTVSTAVKNSSK